VDLGRPRIDESVSFSEAIFFISARRITAALDSACATCIQNGGECYSTNNENTMDGCECPLGRTSVSSAPRDACVDNHCKFAKVIRTSFLYPLLAPRLSLPEVSFFSSFSVVLFFFQLL